MRRLPLAAAADLAAVLVFAAVGRGSHAESLDALAVLATAGPFLAGLALAWALTRAWRDPLAAHTGLGVCAGTAVVGLLLRGLLLGRLPASFAVVAVLALGVFLLGWRVLAHLAVRARSSA